MDRQKIDALTHSIFRLLVGAMYFHFGVLKFFPDLSPAEMIAEYTVGQLTGFRPDAKSILVVLAAMECFIGIGLMTGLLPRFIFCLLIFHIVGTLTPLVLLPEFCFKYFPIAPTLEGQYILKNLPLFASAWILIFPLAFPFKPKTSNE
ncbi:MAG: DoxX family membrane protein [Verrucomicrobia bacterium]|nr:DoxX family membrane protein [Verrucomicrobiota bacterium]